MTCYPKRRVMPLLVCLLLLSASPAAGYEWHAGESLAGWSGMNVTSLQPTAEGVMVRGQPGALFFVLSIPMNENNDLALVSARLRTLSGSSVVTCVLMFRGQVVATRDLPIFSGKSWQEYVFDLRGRKDADSPFDSIAFGFALIESVEVGDVAVKGSSFSELFTTQGLKAHSAHFLDPFKVYGYSVNVLCYAVIAVSGLGIAAYSTIKRRKGALVLMLIPLLLLYLILDLREDYEELAIMRTHYTNYLGASPDEKRYFWADDLIGFSGFVQRNADPGKTVRFFGSDFRYSYLRYLLYPMKIEQAKDVLGEINIFSETDDCRLEGDRLIMNRNVVFENGRGIAFNPRSFLYITP
jgi:hypothetical protein